jgi:hypothetical protein
MPVFRNPKLAIVEPRGGGGALAGLLAAAAVVIAGGYAAVWFLEQVTAEIISAVVAGGVLGTAVLVLAVRSARRSPPVIDYAQLNAIRAERAAAALPAGVREIHNHVHYEEHRHYHAAPEVVEHRHYHAASGIPAAVEQAMRPQAIEERSRGVIPGAVLRDRRPANKEKS